MKINSSEYWMGSFESYLEYQAAVTRIEELSGAEMQAFQHGRDEDQPDFGDGDSDYMMTRAGNVAVIDIKGSLTNKNSPWNKYFGITSYPEIKNAVIEAVNDEGTDSILFSVDSPGGAVSGISELSAFLTDVKNDHMPIETHVGGSMNSGGYWLGSIGEKLTGTRLSQVGSIGVISVHQEYSKYFKDNGIETTVIRQGKYKALGNPYEPLTEEAKSIIEKDMGVVYNEFIATVATNRGVPEADVKNNMAEGQVFWGVDAKRIGLIDDIGTIDSVVTQMHNDHNASNNVDGSPLHAGELTMSGKQSTQVLTDGAVAAIAAGVSVEDAASELGETLPVGEEAVDTSAGAEAGATVEDDAGGTGGDAGAETNTGDGAGVVAAAESGAEAQVSSAVVDLLKSQLADANTQVADLRVENGSLKKDNDSLKVDLEPLKAIAIEATHKMQIALGGSATDMSHIGASAIVDQYKSVQAPFAERFKVGASAEAENQEDELAPAVNEAAVSATKIS